MDKNLSSYIDSLLDLSPPTLLLLCLIFFGNILKRAQTKSWIIPLTLMITGAILYPCVADMRSVTYSVPSPLLFRAMIGFCIGGAATGLHQVVKNFLQSKLNINIDGEEIIIKESNDKKIDITLK